VVKCPRCGAEGRLEEYEWEEYWEDRDAYDELMEDGEDGYDDCDCD
jgi:hypothetical protein